MQKDKKLHQELMTCLLSATKDARDRMIAAKDYPTDLDP
jgi:hypothetical protein